MSEVLKAMEEMASGKSILNFDKISEIMNAILTMKFSDLAGDAYKNGFIARDIAKGFRLEAEKVSELPLKDILCIIGYEPGVSWFSIPEEDERFYKDRNDMSFLSAGSCFLLGKLMLDRKDELPYVEQFMHIDYFALINYLSERMEEHYKKKWLPESEIIQMSADMTNRYFETKDFVSEQNSSVDRKEMTVNDVILTIVDRGLRTWVCGTEPVNKYVERISKTYELMKVFFMDCIRMSVIHEDRKYFKELLKRSSELDYYEPEILEEIDYKYCYEE